MSRQAVSPSEELKVRGLIRDFWTAVDRSDWPHVQSLLTDDVEYQIGASCQGNAAAVKVLKGRPDNLVARHLISNETVWKTEGGYELEYVGFVYSVLADGSTSGPFQTPPANIFDGLGTVLRLGDGLKFSKLSGTAIFMKAR
jgi:hypothetical protein